MALIWVQTESPGLRSSAETERVVMIEEISPTAVSTMISERMSPITTVLMVPLISFLMELGMVSGDVDCEADGIIGLESRPMVPTELLEAGDHFG